MTQQGRTGLWWRSPGLPEEAEVYRILHSLLLTVLLTLGAGFSEEDQAVTLDVWSIRATTRNRDVSPELKELAQVLRKQFKFTGFKLEKKVSDHRKIDEALSTDLIGGYQATFTPKKREKNSVQLRIEVKKADKNVLTTTITGELNRFVPVGVGPLEDSDYLIVATRAR
jgi:hypothetical protein